MFFKSNVFYAAIMGLLLFALAACTVETLPPETKLRLISAVSTSSTSLTLSFDQSVNPSSNAPSNFIIAGLTVQSATVAGQTVNLTTSEQAAQTYTVTVSNITSTSGDPLDTSAISTSFQGTAPVTPPAAVGDRVKITLEKIKINKDCDVGDGEFYGTLSINGEVIWSEPDDKDRHIKMSDGGEINFDSTRTRTKNYRYGTSEQVRISGFLNEDDGTSGDDEAGDWNLNLDPFAYGNFQSFSNPPGANCESTLFYSIQNVGQFTD